MKGLLYDREDQNSFKQIKHDIEEILGFRGVHLHSRNDIRKSNYASSRGGSHSPKARSPSFKTQLMSPTRKRKDSLQMMSPLIKLSPPKTMRSQSAMPEQGPRNRNFTPSFPIEQPKEALPEKKQSVWQKLNTQPLTRQSKANPYYRLDMKFKKLADRVSELREIPEINEKSRQYYGVVGRVMRKCPIRQCNHIHVKHYS